MNQAFTSFRHWVAQSAECARLFGGNKSTTKSLGPQAASLGHLMGSYSRFLTVHPVTNLGLLFFYYRSTRWKFADSLRRSVRGVISILYSPPMVKPWPSPNEFGKEPGIYTVPVSGGEEQRVIADDTDHWGVAWTPDGRDIVFANASWPITTGWLWKIPLRGGEPERLPFGQDGIEPSIQGNRLVYLRQTANLNISRRKLTSLLSAGPPEKFIASTMMESGPQFSPDGSKIVFESTRSGAYEVWMCRSDGNGLTQLTHLNSLSGTPRWSPDGQQIAFDSRLPRQCRYFCHRFSGRLTS